MYPLSQSHEKQCFYMTPKSQKAQISQVVPLDLRSDKLCKMLRVHVAFTAT